MRTVLLRISGILVISLITLMLLVSAGAPQRSAAGTTTDFPQRDISWIVGFAPGGNSDVIARLIAPYISKYLPNQVNVTIENVPGAAATIGLTRLFNARPDGYTIGQAPVESVSTILHDKERELPYGPDGFQTLGSLTRSGQYVVVPKTAPYSTFEQWLSFVRANPGFQVGILGLGDQRHLVMEAFAAAAGVEFTYVVFQGMAQAIPALLGGNVQSIITGHPVILNNIETMQPIVNTTTAVPDFLSYVPSFVDKGFSVEAFFFDGVFAPKNTPPEIVAILDEAFRRSMADPELIKELEAIGNLIYYNDPSTHQELINKNYISTGQVMRAIGMID
jgi:tripartite-type tricarboxylate transporter receptor subunit TctC